MNAKVYRRSGEVEESPVGDRIVLYHCRSGKALVLNPTGKLVWDHLATPATAEAVAEALNQVFPDLARDRAVQDAGACLEQLLAHEAVVVES